MKRWGFNTLADFARACDALSADTKRERSQQRWTGETWDESIGFARDGGTESSVPAAEALIAKIQASLPETVTRRWALDHVGAFPCVPAYLSGEPESMWTLADTPTESAPVRIYVSACSSGGVSHVQLAQRGAAVLALVLLASRTRTVELYTFTPTGTAHGDAALVLRLQSNPMMLSEVSYVLASAGYARNLTYGWLCETLRQDCVTWSDAETADRFRAGPAMRKALGLEPQDVLIGPAHLQDPAVNDSVGFVNAELSKLGLTQE